VPEGFTGGARPEVYVGQAYGPFWLPCHKDENYKGAGTAYSHDIAQCAGAAIFRANVGVAGIMPRPIHRLPADHAKVFSSPEELIAWHTGSSIRDAREFLSALPPEELMRREIRRLGGGQVRRLRVVDEALAPDQTLHVRPGAGVTEFELASPTRRYVQLVSHARLEMAVAPHSQFMVLLQYMRLMLEREGVAADG
jgi:hypothetical protein